MIWYKIPEKDWPAIKTMLVYLHYVDDKEKVEVKRNAERSNSIFYQ